MPLILEVSARAVLLVAGVALMLAALRIRSPRTAHRAWVGVALALIALPLVVVWGPVVAIPVAGDAPHWMAGRAPSVVAADVSGEVDAAPHVAASARAASADAIGWARVLLVVYIAGALAFLARIVVGVVQASALRRQATLVDGRLTSRRCSTPITVGLRAPVVILPVTWMSWSAPELAAVLAHEHEHARCRDPLATLVTLLARALFWFHPLAWWLSRRVAHLSERACDVAVLAAGHDADVYAAALVKFARAQAHAGGRVAAPGIAMGGLALAHRLRLLQTPVRGHTGSARLIAATAAYAVAIILCCTGAPVPAIAVESGQQAPSPAQPSAGNWRSATTEHFDIYAAEAEAHLMADVARQAEEAYAELSAAFNYHLAKRVALAIAGGDIQLRDSTVTVPASFPALAGDLACEATLGDQTLSGTCSSAGSQVGRQVIVVTRESLETQRRLLVHELTHSFAFEIVPEPSRAAPWLIEGLAEHQRGVWGAASVRAVRDAVGSAWVPTVDGLAGADRYWAHAFFDFLGDAYGPEGIRRYLFALRRSPRISDAIPAAFGTRHDEVDRAFRRYVSGRFGTL